MLNESYNAHHKNNIFSSSSSSLFLEGSAHDILKSGCGFLQVSIKTLTSQVRHSCLLNIPYIKNTWMLATRKDSLWGNWCPGAKEARGNHQEITRIQGQQGRTLGKGAASREYQFQGGLRAADSSRVASEHPDLEDLGQEPVFPLVSDAG